MTGIDSLPKLYENSDMDNFTGSQKVKDLTKKWAENYKLTGSVLITGDVGRGKTHLAVAMAKLIPITKLVDPITRLVYDDSDGMLKYIKVWEYQPKIKFQDITMLVMEILKNYNGKSGTRSALETMSTLMDGTFDVIIADDIGASTMTEHTRQIMFVLINYWYSNNVTTIYTTNIPGDKLKDMDERMSSRIMGMSKLKINLTGHDHRIIAK